MITNPDARSTNHNLTPDQLKMAMRLEAAAYKRQLEILARMGVAFPKGTPWPEIARRARKNHGIVINHIMEEDHPEGGFWSFSRNGKVEVNLGHPTLDPRGHIIFRERYMV